MLQFRLQGIYEYNTESFSREAKETKRVNLGSEVRRSKGYIYSTRAFHSVSVFSIFQHVGVKASYQTSAREGAKEGGGGRGVG